MSVLTRKEVCNVGEAFRIEGSDVSVIHFSNILEGFSCFLEKISTAALEMPEGKCQRKRVKKKMLLC